MPRVRFVVVPDTTTRALELRKGSADIASNALTSDMVLALEKEPNLVVQHAPGTVLSYLAFNLRDPILRDVRVRQALAYAIDRRPMIQYLWRDFARPADSILPPQSWAYDADVPKYAYEPDEANRILDTTGYPKVNGVRFHITMKTSTEETTRLMVAVLQQQLREVGIALDIRTFEFATFFADVTTGAYQMYSLRWIPTSSNTPSTPTNSRHTGLTAVSMSTRSSTRLSKRAARKPIPVGARRHTPASKRFSPPTCLISTSGFSITCSCIRGACGM